MNKSWISWNKFGHCHWRDQNESDTCQAKFPHCHWRVGQRVLEICHQVWGLSLASRPLESVYQAVSGILDFFFVRWTPIPEPFSRRTGCGLCGIAGEAEASCTCRTKEVSDALHSRCHHLPGGFRRGASPRIEPATFGREVGRSHRSATAALEQRIILPGQGWHQP